MKTTIKINGKSFSIEELNALIETAKNTIRPIDEVYAYHKTTEEEFNKKHENSSKFIKAIDRESMIVGFYNKGEKVDFDNNKQHKYYPYFDMRSDTFSLRHVSDCSFGFSFAPLALCFLRRKDCEDACEKFLEYFKESRFEIYGE